MTDALPHGIWTVQGGIRRYRVPDPGPMRRHQELTILHILLATRRRERRALDELLRIVRRKSSRKAA